MLSSDHQLNHASWLLRGRPAERTDDRDKSGKREGSEIDKRKVDNEWNYTLERGDRMNELREEWLDRYFEERVVNEWMNTVKKHVVIGTNYHILLPSLQDIFSIRSRLGQFSAQLSFVESNDVVQWKNLLHYIRISRGQCLSVRTSFSSKFHTNNWLISVCKKVICFSHSSFYPFLLSRWKIACSRPALRRTSVSLLILETQDFHRLCK